VPDTSTPLEFFLDRNLGRVAVPTALRDRGLIVHTLADVFGQREQSVPDEEWLEAAGASRWVVLTKDKRIRYRPVELAAVRRHAVRMFCLTRGDLTAAEQADRFLRNLESIERAASRAGPFIYAVHLRRVVEVWPARRRGRHGRAR